MEASTYVNIIDICDSSVILATGRAAQQHKGNIDYCAIVASLSKAYDISNMKEKADLQVQVYKSVSEKGGHFYREKPVNGKLVYEQLIPRDATEAIATRFIDERRKRRPTIHGVLTPANATMTPANSTRDDKDLPSPAPTATASKTIACEFVAPELPSNHSDVVKSIYEDDPRFQTETMKHPHGIDFEIESITLQDSDNELQYVKTLLLTLQILKEVTELDESTLTEFFYKFNPTLPYIKTYRFSSEAIKVLERGHAHTLVKVIKALGTRKLKCFLQIYSGSYEGDRVTSIHQDGANAHGRIWRIIIRILGSTAFYKHSTLEAKLPFMLPPPARHLAPLLQHPMHSVGSRKLE